MITFRLTPIKEGFFYPPWDQKDPQGRQVLLTEQQINHRLGQPSMDGANRRLMNRSRLISMEPK